MPSKKDLNEQIEVYRSSLVSIETGVVCLACHKLTSLQTKIINDEIPLGANYMVNEIRHILELLHLTL